MYQNNKQKNKDILENTQNNVNTETKVFDLNTLSGLNDDKEDYDSLSVEELKIILNGSNLSWREKSKIKKIIKSKK